MFRSKELKVVAILIYNVIAMSRLLCKVFLLGDESPGGGVDSFLL